MSALRLMESKVLCKMGITGAELPSPCGNMGRVQRHRAVPRVVSHRAPHPSKLPEGFEQPGKSPLWKSAGTGLCRCRGLCGAGDDEGYPCPERGQLVALWLRADSWTHCRGWRWINSGWKQSSSSRVRWTWRFRQQVQVSALALSSACVRTALGDPTCLLWDHTFPSSEQLPRQSLCCGHPGLRWS